MVETTTEQHVIDAQGKKLGRVATEVATLLMGKHRSDVVKNRVAPVHVIVENVSKLLMSEKKRNQKEYSRYTGYPGGLRKISMQKLIDKKGYTEVFKKAVYGMLPSNRLRSERMKQLTIHE
jgi:large subunit ribosomal protein L13